MRYDNDGLTRTIGDVIRMAGIILFGAWQDKYKQPKFIKNGAEESFYQRLLRMIDKGEINEAENELTNQLEQVSVEEEKKEYLELALSIYSYINDKDDDFLEENDYSREEIGIGIKNLLSDWGINADTLDAMAGGLF